ncbi:hypothetical protein [Clostridium sp. AN503]|uniref:hypothetical protein n=1 Tax=Clostridium sp. AN503 TaxID=3160598 RepID=UPI00345933AB
MIYIEMTAEVIGKPEPRPWENNGQKGVTHKLNLAQNDGRDMSTVKCPQSVYDTLRRGDTATLRCSYAEYGDRADFKVVDLITYSSTDSKTGAAKPVGMK